MSSRPSKSSRQSWYPPQSRRTSQYLLIPPLLSPTAANAPTRLIGSRTRKDSSLSLSSASNTDRYSRRLITQFRSRSWTDTPQNSPVTPKSGRRILFYDKDKPYYGFTNFSDHPVMYGGKTYPTSEHLFQSLKFQPHKPGLAEHIRTCSPSPRAAFNEAHRFQPEARKDWRSVNVQMMEEVIWHKFTQHDDLREELLSTGDAELVEDSAQDAFWGIGADGLGRNELGKALERLRDLLRGA